jgi:hypothetical protein
MKVHHLSFQTWCENHERAHDAKWCRELYPWDVFARIDYSPPMRRIPQTIQFGGIDYIATVKNKFVGKKDRAIFIIHLQTNIRSEKDEWEQRRWDNEFQLVVSCDGYFITIYAKGDDPSELVVTDFMKGEFTKVELLRSKPISALLFRSLISYAAEEMFGEFDRYAEYWRVKGGIRPLLPHPQFRPNTNKYFPFLSQKRDLWISYAFTEEKAHRIGFYNADQCQQLIVVYCIPTLMKHHRCTYPDTQIISLQAFLRIGSQQTQLTYMNHVRLLMNHLRYNQIAPPLLQPEKIADQIHAGGLVEQEILTSQIREAKAGLELDVISIEDAAYFFACANLLNAALARRKRGSHQNQALLKEVYSFKQRVSRVIEALIEGSISGVEIYIGSDKIVYVCIEGIQFSFHAIHQTDVIKYHVGTSSNVLQEWSGIRLQPIAPLVLEWARALLTRTLPFHKPTSGLT